MLIAAKAGHPECECAAAYHYMTGSLVPHVPLDEAKALHFLLQTTAEGRLYPDHEAVFLLATCYEKGWCGLQPDMRRAVELLTHNWCARSSLALTRLAVLFEVGATGFPKDLAKSKQYFAEAGATVGNRLVEVSGDFGLAL